MLYMQVIDIYMLMQGSSKTEKSSCLVCLTQYFSLRTFLFLHKKTKKELPPSVKTNGASDTF